METADQLIDEFEAVHEEVRAALVRLRGIVERWIAGEIHASDRDALVEIMSWLEEIVGVHEVDEELSLMPRMNENQPALFAQLSEEHDALQKKVASFRTHSTRALRGDTESGAAGDLEPLLSELVVDYETHFALEDEHVFAVARRALDEQAVREIAAEMASRRES
jgi:hemerythrin-like domain-containing protein